MNNKQIIEIFAGPDHYPMQDRIFISAISYSIVTISPTVIFVLAAGLWGLASILSFIVAGYCYVYYLSRYQQDLQKALAVFAITGGSLLNLFWFADRGVAGSASYYFLVAMIIVVFTAERPKIYFAAITINIVSLMLAYDYVEPIYPWKIPHTVLGQSIGLLLALFYVCVLTYLYCKLVRRRSNLVLNDIIDKLVEESQSVNETADQLASASEQLLTATVQQKTATEELSVTTEELGATADQNRQKTTGALDHIQSAEKVVEKSLSDVEELLQAMATIKASSDEIKSINSLVNDIAYQTNILSLNAMIEASRSSDGSGGFKVVALEVKKLAERAAHAVDNINKLLEDNFSAVETGGSRSSRIQDRFAEINETTVPLADTVRNVYDASKEQSEAISQISQGLFDIDRSVDDNRNLTQYAAKTAKDLRASASNLQRIVEQVKEEFLHDNEH